MNEKMNKEMNEKMNKEMNEKMTKEMNEKIRLVFLTCRYNLEKLIDLITSSRLVFLTVDIHYAPLCT